MNASIKTNYSYHFEWLGRPIIQYPQDIVGTQQLLWTIQPDLIIETEIARGGLDFTQAFSNNCSMRCPANAKVLGIDIDIRQQNREAILAYPK